MFLASCAVYVHSGTSTLAQAHHTMPYATEVFLRSSSLELCTNYVFTACSARATVEADVRPQV